jgi:hypothetical protein
MLNLALTVAAAGRAADAGGVDDRSVATDGTGPLELAQAAMAGRDAQIDPRGQLGEVGRPSSSSRDNRATIWLR